MAETHEEQGFSLEGIVSSVIQIPGVRVSRRDFLYSSFGKLTDNPELLIEQGPVAAGISRDVLDRLAQKLILTRTSESSFASFLAGLPGGFAAAATIPADVMQFFAIALRTAQELSYLYGADDLWEDGAVDDERVRNQLILYCGVMFGVSGAAAGVRAFSVRFAVTAAKKLQRQALTKTFWYPLIKQICKSVGIKITKTTVSKGVEKVIPVIGGVVSGGLNFVSMLPMTRRLQHTLEHACFDYSEEEFIADCEAIANPDLSAPQKQQDSRLKRLGTGVSGAFGKMKEKVAKKGEPQNDDVVATIERLMGLKEMGAIAEEEYEQKKAELLARL